ncbi:MAG: RES domain-containing protein, partial [Bryobacteraceae bacterium]
MAFRRNGPIRAFRISDKRYNVFDGMGSYLYGGRWTSEGCRVIYAAETYAAFSHRRMSLDKRRSGPALGLLSDLVLAGRNCFVFASLRVSS